MDDVREIISAIGRRALGEALGVGVGTVSAAAAAGSFPAAWYPTVRKLARKADIAVPDSLFNWRRAEDAAEIHNSCGAAGAEVAPADPPDGGRDAANLAGAPAGAPVLSSDAAE